MGATVLLRDQVGFARPDVGEPRALALPVQQITLRELIRARVQAEVEEYNARPSHRFYGLVQPAEAERLLNGYAYELPRGRPLDWRRQVERAVEAFEGNGFIVLVDDRQVTELDAPIAVGPATTVTFLKLVPLVGG